jgi:hypothetical protein
MKIYLLFLILLTITFLAYGVPQLPRRRAAKLRSKA